MNAFSLTKKFGFTMIGCATATNLDEDYARLLNWLAKGYHGNMAWLAKSAKRRCEPAQIIAEPATVIVCAMRYNEMPVRVQSPAGGMSAPDGSKVKYLQHEDYHIVMMKKLEALVSEIKKDHPNARCKCYVDTGPIMEKAWAVRAGLGFIGKNTLLISPEHGSQMALGVVVADTEVRSQMSDVGFQTSDFRLPAADFFRSPCGPCTACIDACPTKALVAPYILDARKCISYRYFIEKKEGGCDICQDICPYNNANSKC